MSTDARTYRTVRLDGTLEDVVWSMSELAHNGDVLQWGCRSLMDNALASGACVCVCVCGAVTSSLREPQTRITSVDARREKVFELKGADLVIGAIRDKASDVAVLESAINCISALVLHGRFRLHRSASLNR